jgi:hypothetical protein
MRNRQDLFIAVKIATYYLIALIIGSGFAAIFSLIFTK